jgi:iron(III) transport system substrate-binding protein
MAIVGALLAGNAWAGEATPSKITPELIAAAKAEGKIVFYNSVDVQVAERVAKAFEAKFPGVTVQVERSGSERVFQRIGQEQSSHLHVADVVSTSDAAHFVIWKREGLLAPYLPEEVVQHFPVAQREPDSMYAPWRVSLCPIAYNTTLVKPEDVPKSYADLLDPKWTGRMVKAHPGYSGSILTATYQISRDIGWEFFEKLGKQKVMQVQSSTEPPKKLALGERRVMADGSEYVVFLMKDAGAPIDVVYATEGTPLVISPSAIMKDAPHPNAARLFQSYLYTGEAQQALIDVGGLRSFSDQVKEKAGRKPLSQIKLMKEDAAAVADKVEDIKARYTKYFGT